MDITPTWQGILPLLLHHYANPKTREGAGMQLQRLARAADSYNTICKETKNDSTFESAGDAADRVVNKLRGGGREKE
jgi:hypothetical protein